MFIASRPFHLHVVKFGRANIFQSFGFLRLLDRILLFHPRPRRVDFAQEIDDEFAFLYVLFANVHHTVAFSVNDKQIWILSGFLGKRPKRFGARQILHAVLWRRYVCSFKLFREILRGER